MITSPSSWAPSWRRLLGVPPSSPAADLVVFLAAASSRAFFAAGFFAGSPSPRPSSSPRSSSTARAGVAGVFVCATRRSARALGHRRQRVPDRARLDQHDVRPQDVVGRHVAVRHHVHGRQVAAAQEHVRLHAVGENEHLLLADAEATRRAPEARRLAARRSSKRSMTKIAFSRARALSALLRASARTWRGTYCA